MPEQNKSESHLSCRYPTSLFISKVGIRVMKTGIVKRWKGLGIKERTIKKKDNSALVVGLYNHDSCIPVANFFTINFAVWWY